MNTEYGQKHNYEVSLNALSVEQHYRFVHFRTVPLCNCLMFVHFSESKKKYLCFTLWSENACCQNAELTLNSLTLLYFCLKIDNEKECRWQC